MVRFHLRQPWPPRRARAALAPRPSSAAGRAGRALSYILLILVIAGAPASAHGRLTPAGPTSGVSIPNLTHGQMRVIADNQSAIMTLADGMYPTDWTMRRLQAYVSIQRFVCAWGLVPGSITDEDSPFNECAHAYLAATRALLVHLQAMPGEKTETAALVERVETEMLANDASLVLCRYSDEPFNTADYIVPHLGPVPLDPVSVGKMVGGSALLCWLVVLYARRDRHRGSRTWAA